MAIPRSLVAALGVLLGAAALMPAWGDAGGPIPAAPTSQATASQVDAGRRMYMEGVLPTGERMTGIVQGDIPLAGEQVICGRCHRRSGFGAPEGQNVAPPVVADILYSSVRLPTSKPPLAPELRPAYTNETLKRAIREGVGSTGKPLGPLMPRYPLDDAQLDTLIGYLNTLSRSPDPGVTEQDIHFATVIAGPVDPGASKAFLDVFHTYFEQKNRETRHETFRSEHAPWHEAWTMKPYRKWVLHLWELQGEPDSWAEQLRAHYEAHPVFAVISGLAAGPWEPIHHFCESNGVPCILPVTDLPFVNEADFYTVYFNRGMALEADTIAEHLKGEQGSQGPVIQVYRVSDERAREAAAQLRRRLQANGTMVTDFAFESAVTDQAFWQGFVEQSAGADAVLWLGPDALRGLWGAWRPSDSTGPDRVYLSTSLFGIDAGTLPADLWQQVYLVHPSELPSQLPQLLARSAGWLTTRRIAAPGAEQIQANAFLALKMAGEAAMRIRGFFNRDYLLERMENMAENALYTSIYPRVSLAAGQRFLSRGAYIAQFAAQEGGNLTAVTPWRIPAFK